jgi:enediyne biosynthesis protein E4
MTDAVWTDLNGDKRPDLVVVGEWMPITIFYNKGDYFDKKEIENTSGWWNCITAEDMDKDGDNDLIIGNMGLNSNWQASRTQPMSLYVKDFDNSGHKKPLITYWRQGLEWPYNTKDELTLQIPFLKKRFQDYTPFANTSFTKVFTPDIMNGAMKKQIEIFASVYLENKEGEGFELKILPTETQFSTVQSILADDFDDDGNMDIALGGNFHEMQPSIGRFDASFGSILWGNGKGSFTPLSPSNTGFILRGAVRDIKKVGNYIVVASNNAPLQVFEVKRKKKVK